MAGKKLIGVSLIVFASIALIAAGCGSSSSSTNSDASTTPSGSSSETTASEGSEEGEAASEFIFPGKANKEDNEIARYGTEADAEEREQASQVLEESFEARAAHDWAGQCATLSAGFIEGLQKANPLAKPGTTCAKLVGSSGEKAPQAVLLNTMSGPIAAFRIEGTRGYAFYHGTGGKDYLIPLEKDGSQWKAASLIAEEVPHPKG